LTPKETARFIVMLAKPRMKSSGVRALNGRYAFVTVRIQMEKGVTGLLQKA